MCVGRDPVEGKAKKGILCTVCTCMAQCAGRARQFFAVE